MIIFLKLFLAHIAADFLLQPARLIDLKARSVLWTMLHAGIFCLVAVILLSTQLNTAVVAAILVAGILHYLIDLAKLRYFSESTAVFLADQAIHMLVLAAAALYLHGNPIVSVAQALAGWLDSPRFLVVVSALVLVTAGGSAFVAVVMRAFMRNLPPGTDIGGIKSAGAYIGVFERLVVLALTLTGNFTGIGIVFAAKSVIRFPEASSEKHFAEYYLIGTLTSFTIALAVGLIARYLISNQRYFF